MYQNLINNWKIILLLLLLFFLMLYIILIQRQVLKSMDIKIQTTQQIAQTFQVSYVAGAWGEVQLKKIVEIAGMLPYCEFVTQGTINEGRPDLIIKIMYEGVIFVDAKTPITAYLQSINDKQNSEKWLKTNANNIKNHIYSLSKKNYWSTSQSPELVVMFIPSEIVLFAALEFSPDLIEIAAKNNVIIATPTSLIAILKTIAYGWEKGTQNKESNNIRILLKKLQDLTLNSNINVKYIDGIMDFINNHKRTQEEIASTLIKLNNISGKTN